ncbi:MULTISPECIES: outer membrane beta-barrel family protein [Chitinophagaceae]
MNAHNIFTLSGDYGGGNFKTNNEQTSSYFNITGTKNGGSLRTTVSQENFRFGHVNLDHTHQFKKEGEKLVSSFSLEEYNAPTWGTYQMRYASPDGTPLGVPGLQQYTGGIRAHTIFVQSDYTDPLRGGKAKLEAGFKLNWHHDHNHNIMMDYDTITHQYVTNNAATYNFHYQDPTYAVYGNYSDKYGWFRFMAGLRFEQYNYTGTMPDSSIRFSYHNPNIFQSLFLTADLGNGQELHLNYSRRTNRPSFNEVSPRTDYSNPQNLARGNPHLQSEYTNLTELSYNLQKNATVFSATFYVRNTNHYITTYTTTLAPDTLLTTYLNANYNNTYGGELLFKTNIVKWWNITANANCFDTKISASNIDTELNSKGFSWFAKLTSDIQLPQDFALQLSGSYEGPKVIPQGKTLSTGSMDISLKKDFLQRKNLSVILNFADVFNTNRLKQNTYMINQFNQTYLQKFVTRIFKISVNW